MNAQQKSLDFLGIQAKILGLQRYLVMRLRESRFQQGDLALVLGTSLQVTPASWLPAQRPRHSPLVILNREETWMDEEATLVLHDSVASLLSSCLREME